MLVIRWIRSDCRRASFIGFVDPDLCGRFVSLWMVAWCLRMRSRLWVDRRFLMDNEEGVCVETDVVSLMMVLFHVWSSGDGPVKYSGSVSHG